MMRPSQAVEQRHQGGLVDAELGRDFQLGALPPVTCNQGERQPVAQIGQTGLPGHFVERLTQCPGCTVGQPGQVITPTSPLATAQVSHPIEYPSGTG